MRLKRFDVRLFLVLLVALVATLAVACGGDDEDEDEVAKVAPAAATAAPAPAATAAPAPAAAATGGPEYGGTLRFSTGLAFPPKLDLTQTSTYTSLVHYARMYSGLLQFSPRDGTELFPDLATSWEISENGMDYTFKIDPRVTEWHDGTPFTVDDIVFAYKRWIDPPTGIIQPRSGGLRVIDPSTIRKIDEETFGFTLKFAFGDTLQEAANGWHLILPRHILEPNEGILSTADQIIGTGPFKIVEVEQGISTSTTRNDNYFRTDPDGNQYPYLDGNDSVTVTEPEALGAAISTKRIDGSKVVGYMYAKGTEIAKDNPGEFTHSVGPFLASVDAIQLNHNSGPFADLDARRAFALSIDKARILEAHGAEDPIGLIGYYSEFLFSADEILEFPGNNPANREAELALAAELWAKSGVTEFELIVASAREIDSVMAAQDLDKLGIKASVRPVEWTAMIAACEGGKFEAAQGGTAPSYAGVIPILDLMWAEGGGRNCNWTPPADFSTTWDVTKKLMPSPERQEKMRELHDILLDTYIPSIPLFTARGNKDWWNYVHNMFQVPQELFSNNKFEEIWLDSSAPTR